jgi:lipid-A-disaccharide synthase
MTKYFRPLHVMVVAGEPSGDSLGAPFMAALNELTGGSVRFSGVGGPQMEAQGLESLFPMTDLSLMGLVEVVPRIPLLRRRLREAESHALASQPDAVLTIDSPGFNFRLGRRLRHQGFPLIHYVAPQVWAWRPKRAEEIAQFLDHLLVLFPFEPQYFQVVHLPTTFVGHPVVDAGLGSGDGSGFRALHKIPEKDTLLAVLPGSRGSEVGRLLPHFGATLKLVADAVPNLRVVVPTVPEMEDVITAASALWPVPTTVVSGISDKADALAASDGALAASGTITLELALARVPAVIAYRLHPLTALVARRLMKLKFASMVNVILDRMVEPEMLQGNCQPTRLAPEVVRILTDKDARADQVAASGIISAALTPPGSSPSAAAATAVLNIISKRHAGA